MDTTLQERLLKLDYAHWENGDHLAYPRNPDGYDAFLYISQLINRISDLEMEVRALDDFIETKLTGGQASLPPSSY